MARQIIDPFKGSKDLSIASKIIFSRSNTEKMAALLVSHGAPDALRKKRKLVFQCCTPGCPAKDIKQKTEVFVPVKCTKVNLAASAQHFKLGHFRSHTRPLAVKTDHRERVLAELGQGGAFCGGL